MKLPEMKQAMYPRAILNLPSENFNDRNLIPIKDRYQFNGSLYSILRSICRMGGDYWQDPKGTVLLWLMDTYYFSPEIQQEHIGSRIKKREANKLVMDNSNR